MVSRFDSQQHNKKEFSVHILFPIKNDIKKNGVQFHRNYLERSSPYPCPFLSSIVLDSKQLNKREKGNIRLPQFWFSKVTMLDRYEEGSELQL